MVIRVNITKSTGAAQICFLAGIRLFLPKSYFHIYGFLLAKGALSVNSSAARKVVYLFLFRCVSRHLYDDLIQPFQFDPDIFQDFLISRIIAQQRHKAF
jgi:hypothetical protein